MIWFVSFFDILPHGSVSDDLFPIDSRRCLLLAQARPIVFYWFYKVFLSTVFSLVVVPSQKSHARCTQGGKLVFHWFYNGCLAELPVPEGGRQRWDSSIECRAMWEMLDFLRFYKVSGPTVLANFLWPGHLGRKPLFYQRFWRVSWDRFLLASSIVQGLTIVSSFHVI